MRDDSERGPQILQERRDPETVHHARRMDESPGFLKLRLTTEAITVGPVTAAEPIKAKNPTYLVGQRDGGSPVSPRLPHPSASAPRSIPLSSGTPKGIRTPVAGLKGPCPNQARRWGRLRAILPQRGNASRTTCPSRWLTPSSSFEWGARQRRFKRVGQGLPHASPAPLLAGASLGLQRGFRRGWD